MCTELKYKCVSCNEYKKTEIEQCDFIKCQAVMHIVIRADKKYADELELIHKNDIELGPCDLCLSDFCSECDKKYSIPELYVK